mgnify:CR=1 FL=1
MDSFTISEPQPIPGDLQRVRVLVTSSDREVITSIGTKRAVLRSAEKSCFRPGFDTDTGIYMIDSNGNPIPQGVRPTHSDNPLWQIEYTLLSSYV